MSFHAGPFILAIDIGHTNLQAALIDRNSNFHHHTQKPLTDPGDLTTMIDTISDVCTQVLNASGGKSADLSAIGCSVPGSIDPQTGVVVTSSSKNWMGAEIKSPLEKILGRTIFMEGEGAATTLAYHLLGPTRGQDPLLGLNIGSGITAGFFNQGKLFRGTGHAALEVGHIPLFYHGRICICGRQGCWEAHAGGRALRILLDEYRQAGYRLPILPEDLFELANAGDRTAINIWEEQGKLLGFGIAMLLNIFNPRTVVLGGGLIKAWPVYKKSLIKAAREKALPRNAEAAILCSPYPERAALLGAAVAAVWHLDNKEFFIDPANNPT